MADHAELVERPRLENDEVEPTERYSSSEVVVAAAEIKFDTEKKRDAIKSKKLSKKDQLKDLKAAYKTLAHTYDKNDLPKEYGTHLEKGLSTAQYEANLAEYGLNQLTPPKHDPWWVRILKSIFGGFFNVLLWLGSILCFISYAVDSRDPANLYLGIVLATVVTLTGLFSYYQEGKSADLMGSLQAMNKTSNVIVLRDGAEKPLEPVNLVPGDIVFIELGQAVPADIRLFECSPDMEVNNSSLTGESEPCKRNWKPEKLDTVPQDAGNLVFYGTNIVNGKGRGVIFATGDETLMGRTAKLAVSTENDSTPIAKEIKDFVLKVSFIAFSLGISFFIVGMVDTGDLVLNVVFLIGIIVANVPEGLLATVTVSLTLTARRMFEKHVRVKNLESVETLGSTSVICSDKTGTLTTSVMTCQHVYYDLEEKVCDTRVPLQALKGDFYKENGKERTGGFLKLVRCAALCNNAGFITDETDENHGQVQSNANPTEAAMVKFSSGHLNAEYPSLGSVPKYRESHKKLHEIPFNSKNKWQVSVHELSNTFAVNGEMEQYESQWNSDKDDEKKDACKKALVQMKGAPERILALCDRYAYEGKLLSLTDDMRDKIMEANTALGSKGERVLALAELLLDPSEYDIDIEEPVPSSPEYNDKPESSLSGQNKLKVIWNDGLPDTQTYTCEISHIDEDSNEQIPFDECFVYDIKRSVAEKVGILYDSVRLFYSNKGLLAGDCTFSELGIKQGSVIYAYRGPYQFKGSSTDDINWPMRRATGHNIHGDKNKTASVAKEEMKQDSDGEEGLVFIGFYAMIDPPRAGVPEAVYKCQTAGIKVIMVTGDHPVTAKAIAEQVGIISANLKTGEQPKTIDDIAREQGKDLKDIKDLSAFKKKYNDDYNTAVVPGWELQKILDTEKEDPHGVADFWNMTLTKDNVVFARTSPQQKLLIVTAVQERGGIVAVTGDGVNDSPALKKADIGVAMGITGTDVAKEAADMVLLDDNFASIVNGVEEGRIIFDNLKKSIAYTLSSNIPEIAPFLLFQTVGIPLALSTVMILLVDLGTDLAPAISMAYEGREADIMKLPPRDPSKHKLVTWRLVSFAYLQIGMLQAIAGFYAYFVVLAGYGLQYQFLPGLDKFRVFPYILDGQVLRDSYWLWCWDNSDDNDGLWKNKNCIYTPEFEFEWQALSDYYDDLLQPWLKIKDEKKYTYVKNAKNHMFDTCRLSKDCTFTENDRKLLDGEIVNNRQLVWNATSDKPPCSNNCTAVSFSYNWINVIEPMYRKHTKVNKLYPSRRCEFVDFSDNYNPTSRPGTLSEYIKIHPKTPSVCNPYDHKNKPRTYNTFPGDGNLHNTGRIEPPSNRVSVTSNAPATGGNIAPNNLGGSKAYTLFPMQTGTRSEALSRSNSAYFISIIIVQWADLMICKTRRNSLFAQGMVNTFMNFSLLFETILGAFLVYVPVANRVTTTRPLRFTWWCAAVPFSLMIYIYDETRKGWIRKHNNGWLHRNTYW